MWTSRVPAGLPPQRRAVEAHERMGTALAVARTTPLADVPVGAVVFDPHGRPLACATNQRETCGDPTAHAEVLALRAAAARFGDGWRLTGCSLYVTLEPCTMCAGAILGARISEVVFGAWEPKTGAVGSLYDVLRDSSVRPPIAVVGGVREEECAALLKKFFAGAREQG
ncbi:nucleoside deaminase [Corynebacterium uberis]|uniref:nucleoside deaminase n=2 Tax=Corynebacterium TaxID=1716 RepID=UPI0037DCBD96